MKITPKLPAVRRAMQEQAWAILPSKLEAMLEVLEAHATRGGFTADEVRERLGAARSTQGPRSGRQAAGKIAVLPLYGVIAQRMDMFSEMSGGTSTQRFADEFDAAMADETVSAIVIDCDSPGGSVHGTPELAKRIHAARGQGKPIVAVANSTMASAAYWICSAADEVVASPSADVGSIGVFCVHLDASEYFAKEGLKHTIIKAGEHKAEGHPYGPLDEDALAFQQAQVDEFYGMFVGAVAKHRGVKASQVEADYGQGRTLTAKQALAAGMIDRVATLEETVKRLGGGPVGLSGRPRAAEGEALPIAAVSSTLAGDAVFTQAADALVAQLVTDALHAATMTASLPTPAGADARVLSLTPEPHRPHQAKEQPVNENTVAPHGADPAAIIAAERKRASEIRALGREHKIDPDKVEAVVESGASVDAASTQFLAILREQAKGASHITVGPDRATQKPFETLGHFAAAVMSAGDPNSRGVDPRLAPLAAAQGMNQGVPSEGGFLIPPSFAKEIWDEASAQEGDLLSLTDNYTIEGESLTIPANAETSRANGSRYGGVRGYWINEADQITKSTPKVRALRLEPQELAVLVYATEKSLRNSPAALQQFLTRAGGAEISFMTNAALFSGTGAGQPLGYSGADCAITVAKETGQAAATVNQENISKMWARLHPRARANAVWCINADVEPALDTLSTVVKNVAATENVGGYANKVFDAERRTLKGRPIMVCEFCETLGTAGDIVLAAWDWYATGTRGSGLRADTSLHVRFEYAEQAFRFMYEVDGQPFLASAITPFKGSNTQSSIVKLATRS